MHHDTVETPTQTLEEARAKLEAVREALVAAVGDRDAPEPIRRAVARLEWEGHEIARIEDGIAVREGLSP